MPNTRAIRMLIAEAAEVRPGVMTLSGDPGSTSGKPTSGHKRISLASNPPKLLSTERWLSSHIKTRAAPPSAFLQPLVARCIPNLNANALSMLTATTLKWTEYAAIMANFVRTLSGYCGLKPKRPDSVLREKESGKLTTTGARTLINPKLLTIRFMVILLGMPRGDTLLRDLPRIRMILVDALVGPGQRKDGPKP